MDIRMLHYTGGQAPQANATRTNGGQSSTASGKFAALSSNVATGLDQTTPVAAVQSLQDAVNSNQQNSFSAALSAEQRAASDQLHYQDLGRGTRVNILV